MNISGECNALRQAAVRFPLGKFAAGSILKYGLMIAIRARPHPKIAERPVMERTNATLTALRRILRATDLHGREVARSVGLTAVQLRLLKLTYESKAATAKYLASNMRVSQATITALLDKLATRGMIERRVSSIDRRQKNIIVTEAGRQALQDAPDPMQRDFAERFEQLADWEQAMLLAAAERIAELLRADDLEAAPLLTTGEIAGEVADTVKVLEEKAQD